MADTTTTRPARRTRRRAAGTGSVYPLASGKWRGSVLIDGPDGRKVRRFYQANTSAEVVARITTAQAEADAAARAAALPSLAWWSERWLGAVRLRVRPGTWRLYEQALRVHVLPGLGDRLLIDLRPADVESMLSRLVRSGLAPSSVALVRRVLVVWLGDAEREGRIPRNVARLARAPRVDPVERRRLSPAEVRHLLALAADDPQADLLLHLAVGTGARIGELCAVSWDDLDTAARTLAITGTIDGRGARGPTKSRRRPAHRRPAGVRHGRHRT